MAKEKIKDREFCAAQEMVEVCHVPGVTSLWTASSACSSNGWIV
jgi:hypothetical protein